MSNLFTNFSFETWTLIKAGLVTTFTVLIGAAAARSWQQRNWLTQQRISDQEKINSDTKKLFDDFIEIAGKRHFRTQRLYWALKAKDKSRIDEAKQAYTEVLYEWNDAELSWRVRFVKNLDIGTQILSKIDDNIRMPFVATGQLLERGLARSKENKVGGLLIPPRDCEIIEANLISISRAVFSVGRQIYGKLDYLTDERLDGGRLVSRMLSKAQFNELSVSQLFRAVLSSNRNRHT